MDDQTIQAISLEPSTGIAKTIVGAIKRFRGWLHSQKLSFVAKSVNSVSENETDMKRIAATFKSLVHIDAYEEVLSIANDLAVTVDNLETKFGKKSVVLKKRNKQIKELKDEKAELREKLVNQELVIQRLLERAGLTATQFLEELKAERYVLESDKASIEEGSKLLLTQLTQLQKIEEAI